MSCDLKTTMQTWTCIENGTHDFQEGENKLMEAKNEDSDLIRFKENVEKKSPSVESRNKIVMWGFQNFDGTATRDYPLLQPDKISPSFVSKNKIVVCHFQKLDDTSTKNNPFMQPDFGKRVPRLLGSKEVDSSICYGQKFKGNQLSLHETTSVKEELHQSEECEKRYDDSCLSKGDTLNRLGRVNSKKKSEDCLVCEQGFTTLKSLRNHLLVHSKEKPFKCQECGKAYCNSGSLKNHFFTHKEKYSYKCTVCQKSFVTLRCLRRHLPIHFRERSHICSECGCTFRLLSHLTEHMVVHSGKKQHKCPECSQRFGCASSLSRHMSTHIKGSLRGKSFSRLNNSVRDYKLIRRGEIKPHECTECTKKFKYIRAFKKHMENHRKRFECHECKRRFSGSDALKSHMVVHAEKNQFSGLEIVKKYICSSPQDRPPNTHSRVKLHSRKDVIISPALNIPKGSHTRQKIEKCPECDQRFRGDQFRLHMASHIKEELHLHQELGNRLDDSCSVKTGMLISHTGGAHAKKERHGCPECGKTFTYNDSLRNHLLIHSEKRKPYKCQKCRKAFKSLGSLKRHACIHKREHFHKCTVCVKTFTSLKCLRRHLLVCNEAKQKPYICTDCGRRFRLHAHLVNHMVIHSVKEHQECLDSGGKFGLDAELNTNTDESRVCGKIITRLDTNKGHQLTPSGEKPHECIVCNRRFKCIDSLNGHMRVHTKDEQCVCQVCGKRCRSPGELRAHMVTHTGEKPYECPICNKKFGYSSSLKKHVNTHKAGHVSAPRGKPVNSECRRDFRVKDKLRVHMVSHTGKKAFVCPECGMRFGYSSSLRKHVNVHKEKQNDVSLECRKSFIDLSNHKAHMVGHTGDKPIAFQESAKIFSHPGSQREHVNSNKVGHVKAPRGKRLKCSECNKDVRDSDKLRRHMISHTGEKAFVCPKCGKRFGYSESLKKHVFSRCRKKLH